MGEILEGLSPDLALTLGAALRRRPTYVASDNSQLSLHDDGRPRLAVIGRMVHDDTTCLRRVRELRSSDAGLTIAVVQPEGTFSTLMPGCSLYLAGVDRVFTITDDRRLSSLLEFATRSAAYSPPPALRAMAVTFGGSLAGRVATWAHRNARARVSATTVASLFCRSRAYLYRSLLLEYRTTLGEQLSIGRFLWTAHLRQLGLPLAQIAAHLGYESASGVANTLKRNELD